MFFARLSLLSAVIAFTSVNGLAIRSQQADGPDASFNLKLVSDSFEWNGQYIVPQMIGQGFDVAAISPMPFVSPSFWCDHASQELRCNFTDASHLLQPSELVGAFASEKLPGQTFQPLYFAAKGTKGLDTTKALGFTKDNKLTFNGAPCSWYACRDTMARVPGAKEGKPIFAVNLLAADKPMNPACKKVEIIKELK